MVSEDIKFSRVKDREPLFPASSCAVTVITLVPCASGIPLMLHDVVPFAVTLPPVELLQVTAVTPVLSTAMPPREIRGLCEV